jgi:peptide subunit release factor 1 (eRF1)
MIFVCSPKRRTLKYNEVKKVFVTIAEDAAKKSNTSVQVELDAITERLAQFKSAPSNSSAVGLSCST